MAWNSAGTVGVTLGSDTLTGTGTNWINQEPGWWVWIEGESKPHEIETVVSATEITLVDTVDRATATGLNFLIIPTQGLNVVLRERIEALLTTVASAEASWAQVVTDFSSSSYQLWLDEGNTGTVQDFLDALVGPQGATGATGATGAAGADGTDGENGWTPRFAIVSDGARRVLQVSDWVGGEGTKPATGDYVGATGLVSLIADGIDIRGPEGAAGAGSGDMVKSTYDTNDSGVVDDAEALGGAAPADYALVASLSAVATSGSYNDLANLPSLFDGTYAALTGKPTLGAMSGYAEASAAQVRSLDATALGLTTRRIRDAAALTSPSGAANWTPDWGAFLSADWQLTGNRTINNPTNVVPGTTRHVFIRGDSATAREVTFGSNFKGALPTLDDVTDTKWYVIGLLAYSATHIVVTFVDASP